ncbi:MAG: hypothetical protein ACFUZC_15690 [Chthoniobacteraceae bacterium]
MDQPLSPITCDQLKTEAAAFAQAHTRHSEPALVGLDFPVVEAYYLLRFKRELARRYELPEDPEEDGIAFPDIKVDVKFVNDRLNDSFCPMISRLQKVKGLGYDVLLFVYHQESDFAAGTVWLEIRRAIWVENYRTADWYATTSLLDCLAKKPLMEDLLSLFDDFPFMLHPGEAWKLAEDSLKKPPQQGYAAIGRASLWHIRWGRVISEAGKVDGIQLLV